ncbi:nuclear exosome regulator NRDE2-like [Schistocerca gregaria]|uniref:nuclear exosome regulator NRDE2-like n=1 Tax=Schistocerca gregaria TaxID=7010 RepID=UPI00211DBA1E|nr:nuclear exosome regulator NRDE2-like [Schistocerca gregaria]
MEAGDPEIPRFKNFDRSRLKAAATKETKFSEAAASDRDFERERDRKILVDDLKCGGTDRGASSIGYHSSKSEAQKEMYYRRDRKHREGESAALEEGTEDGVKQSAKKRKKAHRRREELEDGEIASWSARDRLSKLNSVEMKAARLELGSAREKTRVAFGVTSERETWNKKQEDLGKVSNEYHEEQFWIDLKFNKNWMFCDRLPGVPKYEKLGDYTMGAAGGGLSKWETSKGGVNMGAKNNGLESASFGGGKSREPKKKKKKEELRYYDRLVQAKLASTSIEDVKRKGIDTSCKEMEEAVIEMSQDLKDGSNQMDEVRGGSKRQELTVEQEILVQAKALNEKVFRDPSNIQAWRELVEFQDQYAKLMSRPALKSFSSVSGMSEDKEEANYGPILAKKLEIYKQALQKNPGSEDLLVEYLNCARKYYDSRTMNEIWEPFLKSHSAFPKVWFTFMDFVLSDFSQFTATRFRKASSEAIQALSAGKRYYTRGHAQHKKLEGSLLSVLINTCRIEAGMGYIERAVALLQALIEVNFYTLDVVQEAFNKVETREMEFELAREKLQNEFKRFWDSEAARFGEQGARGWSFWYAEHQDEVTKEELYDPFTEDNKVVRIEGDKIVRLERINEQLREPFSGTLGGVAADSEDEGSSSAGSADLGGAESKLEELGPEEESERRRLAPEAVRCWIEVEGNLDAVNWCSCKAVELQNVEGGDEDVERMVLFEDVKEFLVLFSYDEFKFECLSALTELLGIRKVPQGPGEGQDRLWSSYDKESESVFSLLSSRYPEICSQADCDQSANTIESWEWFDPYELGIEQELFTDSPRASLARNSLNQALELCISKDRPDLEMQIKLASIALMGKERAKALLALDDANLVLWNAYAQYEKRNNRIDQSRHIYDVAIQRAIGQPDVALLVRSYALMELELNCVERARHVLFSIPEMSHTPFREGTDLRRTGTQVLKARKNYERVFAKTGDLVESFLERQDLDLRSAIDVFFNLTVCCAFFEYLTGDVDRMGCVVEAASLRAQKWLRDFSVGRLKNKQTEQRLMRANERLYVYQVNLILTHIARCGVAYQRVYLKEAVHKALCLYPCNRLFLSALLLVGQRTQTTAQHHRYFDKCIAYLNRSEKSADLLWLFSIRSETRCGSANRVFKKFERALASALHRRPFQTTDEWLSSKAHDNYAILLWKMYADLALAQGRAKVAMGILFRAIESFPWAKWLWLGMMKRVGPYLSFEETAELLRLLCSKELRVRRGL